MSRSFPAVPVVARFLAIVSAVLWLIGHAVADSLFWTDTAAGEIGRANLDGTGQATVLTGLSGPRGIAFDLLHNRLYWVESDRIRRSNLDGSNIQTVVTDLDAPHGMVLHPAGGKLYWTERGAIRRSNYVGTQVETIVSGLLDPPPSHIAVDTINDRVYWADSVALDGQVWRSGLDGGGAEVLFQYGAEVSTPNGIAVSPVPGGFVYWTDATGRIVRGNLDGAGDVTLIDGLNGPGDVSLHVGGGRMYFAQRFEISRANLDGTGVQTLVTGLSRGEGITLDVTPPTVPPVLAGNINHGGTPGSGFEAAIDFRVVSPLDPGEPLALNLSPLDTGRGETLFDTLTILLDGDPIAQWQGYIAGELTALDLPTRLDPGQLYTLGFVGTFARAYEGDASLQWSIVSPALIPEPAAGIGLTLALATAGRRRPGPVRA
jgi:hypothetical protein